MAGRGALQQAEDTGFTMVELLLVMVVSSILLGIASTGFVNWRNTSQHLGSADELVSELRSASTQAVSEGRTYCMDVKSGGRVYELWQKSCGGLGSTRQGQPIAVQGPDVALSLTVTASTPAPACPATSTCVYFYPRGTATPSTVTVSSSKRAGKIYIVRVEGLTSRVYM